MWANYFSCANLSSAQAKAEMTRAGVPPGLEKR